MIKPKHAATFMKAAYVFAELSYCKRRQVGCLIVKHDTPIAVGYNGTPSGELNQCEDQYGVTRPDVIHAEDNCLRKLTRSHESAEGASVFVTTAPCILCAGRLVDAGVAEVYYDEIYRNEDGLRYLEKHGVRIQRISKTGEQ